MKYLKVFIIICALVSVGLAVQCQNPFKPLALPTETQKAALKLGATAPATIVQNSVRFLVDVTAIVLENNTQLAGGFGVGLQHNVFDAASNAYVTKYSISALGFLGTNGATISGTAGLIIGIPGTNGLVQVGPGYDFTNKQFVILTGVGIKFN